MKRDIFIKNHYSKQIVNWLISFLIASTVFLIFLLILSVIQLKFMLDKRIIGIILITALSFSCCICAYIHCCLSKIKGIFSGLITAAVFSVIKLIMSVAAGGIGKGNFVIYICLICAGVLGGILAANRKSKAQKQLGKINKSF